MSENQHKSMISNSTLTKKQGLQLIIDDQSDEQIKQKISQTQST